MNDELLQQLAQQLGEQLAAQHLSLATAESCTGGWVSKIITDIDGSSRWFALCRQPPEKTGCRRTLLVNTKIIILV